MMCYAWTQELSSRVTLGKRRSTESQSQETHGCFQKAVGLLSFDSCFHVLSLYVSLPSEFENITRWNSRIATKQRFWIYSARLEIYWQPATIGGDFWCSKRRSYRRCSVLPSRFISPRSSCPYGKPGVSPGVASRRFCGKCSAEASRELRILTSLSKDGLDSTHVLSVCRQTASWRSILHIFYVVRCYEEWGADGRWKSVSFINVYQTGRSTKLFGLNIQIDVLELEIFHFFLR